MNQIARHDRLSAGVAIGAAGAALSALAAQVLLGGAPTLWLILGAVAGAIAALAGVVLLVRQCRGQRLEVESYIEQLRQTQPQQFGGDIEQLLPATDASGPMHAALEGLRQYLIGVAHAYQQAERDRARAEVRYRRLVAENEHLTDILEHLADPVLTIDEFDELAVANSSAKELFALQAGGGGDRALASLVRCEQLVELLTETRRRQAASTRSAEVEIGDTAGNRKFYNATVTTLAAKKDGAAETQGAVAVLRDISEQKEIQRRHAEFVSSVSHEMKTPLASIKAYVELLVDGEADDDATREEFLEVINGQADRLQRLIENLLNIARIEAGVVDVDKQQQSLNDVLDEALGVVQPAAEQKGQQLISELSPMYLGVLIDRDMILQTAINLLSNAVKYTPAGGAVTLRSRASDERVTFEVQDTGVGLCAEDKDKVFSKFYRVKKDQRMAAGTGLGLPLAKHIVEEVHGGQLTVESAEGQGSTFRVSLPRIKGTATN